MTQLSGGNLTEPSNQALAIERINYAVSFLKMDKSNKRNYLVIILLNLVAKIIKKYG